MIKKVLSFFCFAAAMPISLYAANASFFLMLSFFPGLLLLLGLLRDTPLGLWQLRQLLAQVIPQALFPDVEALMLAADRNSTAAMVGVSAAAALWSASRGLRGLRTGLNGVYGSRPEQGYFRIRFGNMLYTLAFLALLLLTLTLHVFGTELLQLLQTGVRDWAGPLTQLLDLRWFWLLCLQAAVFTALYMVLPEGKRSVRSSLPGALLASLGWQIFSIAYSVYVEKFASLQSVYGSLYAVPLGLLWLYCCMSILFYGGALNHFLEKV